MNQLYRFGAGLIVFLLFVVACIMVWAEKISLLWLLMLLPLFLVVGYGVVLRDETRQKVQDWVTDYAFGVTAVVSAWMIGVLLILWVVVVLVWGPQDDLTVHNTVAEQPRITVAQPRTILANGSPAALLVTVWNETAVVQATTLTITKSPTLPVLFVENPQAMTVSRTWTVSPTTAMTDVVELVNDGGETAVFRQPVSLSFTTSEQDRITTQTYAEGIPGLRLRQFVNNTVNQASPLIILVAFLVPGLSAISQQMIKNRKETRQKEAEDKQKKEEESQRRQQEEREEAMQKLIEQVRRQLRLGDVHEASQLLSDIKSSTETSAGEWDKQVELITELLKLAELKLKSTEIGDAVEKGREWPHELVACYLAAWNKNDDKEYRAALTKARRLLPVAQINPELQDSLAMVELEIVQREKAAGEFKPVLNWPLPPQHRGVGVKPVSPFIAKQVPNGRDPFAHEYTEDELSDLFADETKLAFWGGHPLFNALFTVDRVTLVHSAPGNGRTAFAYGLHYYAARREVFALYIPDQPDIPEIQRRYVLHLCDFVLAYPGYLRRMTTAEMDLLAHLLAAQMGKPVVLGRIQARQAALSACGGSGAKQDHASDRAQLQLFARKIEAVPRKQDNSADWVMSGISTAVHALGFKRAFLVLEANNPNLAEAMMETLLPQAMRWQASGFFTIFFLSQASLLKEQRGEYYRWPLTWTFAQLERAITWRYRAFAGAHKTILALFETGVFETILRQSSCGDDNLSYNPRKFIQLWHNVTASLQDENEITQSSLHQYGLITKSVTPSEFKELTQAEQFAPPSPHLESGVKVPDRKRLRQILDNYFDVADIQTICFDFGADKENFSDKKPEISVEVITFFEHVNRLDDLWKVIQEQRPFLLESAQA
jgi:hypothetical protein